MKWVTDQKEKVKENNTNTFKKNHDKNSYLLFKVVAYRF